MHPRLSRNEVLASITLLTRALSPETLDVPRAIYDVMDYKNNASFLIQRTWDDGSQMRHCSSYNFIT